jgi:hypothetical protein
MRSLRGFISRLAAILRCNTLRVALRGAAAEILVTEVPATLDAVRCYARFRGRKIR